MQTDFRVKASFVDHPKTNRLRRAIGENAVDYLLRLWSFAAQQRPNGALTGMEAAEIADVCRWAGEPEVLLAALLDGPVGGAGYLERDDDGVLWLHDWQEEQPWVATSEERRTRATRAAKARWKAAATKSPKPKKPVRAPKPKTNAEEPLGTAPAGEHADAVEKICAHYRTYAHLHGHPEAGKRLRASSPVYRKIVARLTEGYTPEELCEAIDGIHTIPHNLGENERQTPYLELDLIFRDQPHVDKYIAAARRPRRPVRSQRELAGLRAAEAFLSRDA